MASATPSRFIGLDIHKYYLVAIGVNAQQEQVFGPHTVQLSRLEAWVKKHLTQQDALVMEMSTNSFELHDELVPCVHSVTLVHPPHVALIVRAQVKTDKKAALTLAQLHAAGLLPAIWVPPVEVREAARPGCPTHEDGAAFYPGQEPLALRPAPPSYSLARR